MHMFFLALVCAIMALGCMTPDHEPFDPSGPNYTDHALCVRWCLSERDGCFDENGPRCVGLARRYEAACQVP
jgi:hypothetical protein